MPTQIQLKTVKTVEIGPESAVPATLRPVSTTARIAARITASVRMFPPVSVVLDESVQVYAFHDRHLRMCVG